MSLIIKGMIGAGVVVGISVVGCYYAINHQSQEIDKGIDLYIETMQKKTNAILDVSVIKKSGMESSYGELRFSPKKDLNVTDQSITIKYEINHGLSTLITKKYPIQGTYLIKHNDDDVTVSSNGKDNEIEGTFDGIVNNSSKKILLNSTLNAFKIGDEKNSVNVGSTKSTIEINQETNLGKVNLNIPSISDDNKMVTLSNMGFLYQFDLNNINLYEGSFNIQKIQIPAFDVNINNVGMKINSFLNKNKKLDMTVNLKLENMSLSNKKDISFELDSLFGGINMNVINTAEKMLNAQDEKEVESLMPKLKEAAIKNLNDGIYVNLKNLNLKKGNEYIKANGDLFLRKEEKSPLNIELAYESQSNVDLGMMIVASVNPVHFLTDEDLSLSVKVKENSGKLTVKLKDKQLEINGESVPIGQKLESLITVSETVMN